MTLLTSDDYLHHLCAVIEEITRNCIKAERLESNRELQEIKLAAYALVESFNTFGYDMIVDESIEPDDCVEGDEVFDSMMKEIIERFDLVRLIEEDTKLEKRGKNYQGLCPFHEEKTPSFTVAPYRNFYYCFGCHASGNALDYLITHNKMTKHEACKFLIESVSTKEKEKTTDDK